METLKDIKTYIADMEKYCKVIESDATIPIKLAFNNMRLEQKKDSCTEVSTADTDR